MDLLGLRPRLLRSQPRKLFGQDTHRKIVGNCQRAFYSTSELHYSRYEVAINALAYIRDLGKQSGPARFDLPRVLCGPFERPHASIPPRYDERTEAGLREIFSGLDGGGRRALRPSIGKA